MENKNILFTVHPPVEFIYAVHFAVNEEAMDKFFLEFNYTQNLKVKDKIRRIKENLSDYIVGELNYFFKWPEMKHVMGRISVENYEAKSVKEFIQAIRDMDSETFILYLLKQCFYESPREFNTIEELMGESKDDNVIIDIINNSSIKENKDKLVYCFENPEEVKQRLCLVLKQFYEKAYIMVEGEILEELNDNKVIYEKLYEEKPKYFFDEYIKRYANSQCKKFIINLGYFIQIRPWLFYIDAVNDVEWINIGMYTEQFPKSSIQRERVKKFLKILSDNKRFEMIELLGEKSWYGYELAEKLGITPPTVSYHVNSLLDLNLVYFERENNKTYYHLNKDKLKELSSAIVTVILKED